MGAPTEIGFTLFVVTCAMSPSLRGSSLPLLGRKAELARLTEALRKTASGEGNFWIVSGPVGIGKSRLLEEVCRVAEEQGFQVLSGTCSRIPRSACEPLEGALEGLTPNETPAGTRVPTRASLLIAEGPPSPRIWEVFRELAHSRKSLVVSRDFSPVLKEQLGNLAKSVSVLQLSRKEAKDSVSPTSLDALGERIDGFLRLHSGSVVAIPDLEYLVVQNSFLAVLRLLQFLREVADATQGHILLSFNPKSLDAREAALLEGEGEPLVRKDGGRERLSPEAPTLLSPQTRLQSYLEKIEKAARSVPLLLVLEDLGWSDPETPSALSFLVRNTRHLPVMVLGAIRSSDWGGEVTGNVPLNEEIDELARQGLLSRMNLHALPTEDIQSLIQSHLTLRSEGGTASEPRLLALPLDHASGNPLVALELVRALVRKDLLQLRENRWVLVEPKASRSAKRPREQVLLHQGLRHLVLGILEDLEPLEKDMIETAAAIGPIFPKDALAAILDVPAEQVRDLLRKMDQVHQFFSPSTTDPETWRFSHPYFHEVIIDNMVPDRLAALSADLAEWFRWNRPQDLSMIGRLFVESKEGVKGIPWVLKAAESALARGDGYTAQIMAEGALALLGIRHPSRERVLETLVSVAETLSLVREHARAEVLLTRLLESRPPPEISWRTRRLLVDTLLSQRKLGEAKSVLTQLSHELADENSTEARRTLLTCEVLRAEFEMLAGDAETSSMTTMNVLKKLEEDSRLEAWECRALEHQGWSLLGKDNLAKAALAFARGREIARRLDLVPYIAFHANGLGRVETLKGNAAEALRYYSEAQEAERRLGDFLAAAEYQRLAAEVLYLSGRLGEAEEAAIQSLQTCEKFDALATAGRALYLLGKVNIERHRWEDAKVNLSLAINRFTLSGETGVLDEAKLFLALVQGETGNPRGAFEEVGPIPSGGAFRHLILGRLRELLGDAEEAQTEMRAGEEEARTLSPLEQHKVQDLLRAFGERSSSPIV